MFLTQQDFKTLFFSAYTNEQATVIAKHLENKCFISNERMYTITPKVSYVITIGDAAIKKELLNIVSILLMESHEKLSKEDSEELALTKKLSSVHSNSHIGTYFPQLLKELTNDHVMDDYYDEMHFANGVYNMASGTFGPREIGKHFITYHIDYDYEAPTKKQMSKMKSVVSKIFPLSEDFVCFCKIFGSALTGRSTIDQTMLFMLGEASSGKSVVLELTALAIQKYFVQLKDNTFVTDSSTADKTFNTFYQALYIRLAWINEPKDKMMDGSIVKQFNDGKLQTVKLYKDGSESFEHRAKAVVTANTLPRFISDGGFVRRIKAYLTTAKFVDSPDDVDESKQIYLKDKSLLHDIKCKSLQIAWFQILADAAQEWLENRIIDYPENFTNAKSEIVDGNDTMKDFIDGRLVITNDDNDRVSKHAMHEEYKLTYPDKHISQLQLLTSLKEKKIKYSPKYRHNRVQGCYYGVRIIETDEDLALFADDCSDDGIDNIDRSDKSVNVNLFLKSENEALKKKIIQLENQIKQQNNPSVMDAYTDNKHIRAIFNTAKIKKEYNDMQPKRKGFGIIYLDDEDYINPEDDDYEEIEVKKTKAPKPKRRGFGIILLDDEDYINPEDDDYEEIEVKKTKAPKKLSTKDISDCLDTLEFF